MRVQGVWIVWSAIQQGRFRQHVGNTVTKCKHLTSIAFIAFSLCSVETNDSWKAASGLRMRADSATGKLFLMLKLNSVICKKEKKVIYTQWKFCIFWHVATQTGNIKLSQLAGGCLLILYQCMAWSCVPECVLTWNEEKQTVAVCFRGLCARRDNRPGLTNRLACNLNLNF